MTTTPRFRAAGFTLIEILIAVAIVAILVTIAWPSYAAAIRKAHRAEAQSYMMALMLREQQYLSDARAYTGDLATLGVAPPSNLAPYYTFAVTVPSSSPPTFVITATAIGSQADDGPLTLDQTGAKTPPEKW